MFLGCKNIIDIDLSSFDTRNITSMCGMFQDCNNIKSIDLSSFDTQEVNNIQYMLYNCTNLNNIFFSSSFKPKNAIKMNEMFYNCKELKK